MLPAGKITEETIAQLGGLMKPGDTIIDGGNTNFKDDVRRARELKAKGIHYLDIGASGGVWGLQRGYCLMIGGDEAAVNRLDPIFSALAPGLGTIERTEGREELDPRAERGYIHAGPVGAGHFVKTVHNGIEYGIEQILAEAYDLMKRGAGLNGDAMADVLGHWNSTEELSSFLVEITEICLRTKDPASGGDLVELIVDAAGQKGTGLWTVESALEMGVPVPTIYAALNARVLSSMRPERLAADGLLQAPAAQPIPLAPLMDACVLACMASYAQGMALMQEASKLHSYNLDMSPSARSGRGAASFAPACCSASRTPTAPMPIWPTC